MKRLHHFRLTLLLLFFFHLSHAQTKVLVKIDPHKTFQTIEGFGGGILDFNENFPSEYSDPEFTDLLVNDLGVSVIRTSVPHELELFNDDDNPDHFNWEGFNMLQMQKRMEFLAQCKKLGVSRFIASTWSPPAFTKTNRSLIYGGYLRMDKVEEYAENMAAFIMAAKKNWDIDIGAISVQNELMFIEPYKSCLYNPYTLREAVRALEQKFSKENIHTKILLPEDMMFLDRMLSYIEPTMNDPETRDFNGHFATHRHGKFEVVQQWHEAVKKYDRQYWMTETSGHLPNWQGAFQLAIDMYDYLVGGNFSLWVYWQLSEPEKENVDDNVYTLMIDGKPTPKYYASKHYYRYIRPGAVRIDATSDHPGLLVSSFKHHENGTFTTLLINKSDEALSVSVNFGSKKDVPKTFQVFRSSSEENCIELSPIKSRIKKFAIPPKSIVTLYGESEALKSREQTATWEVAWQATETHHPAEKWGSFAPIQEGEGEGIVNMARINRVDLLEQQIEAGKLQATTTDGWTALHAAIRSGSAEAVEYLIGKGADVNQPAKDGWTPLHAAAATFVGTQHDAGEKPLTKYDIFSMILNQAPDVHAITQDGWTPLHAAAANAHTAWRQERKEALQKISALIEKGSPINAIDIEGRTPLHYAAWQGHSDQLEVTNEVVERLLKLGADPNINDNWGKTPLHYAAEMGYASIVSVLLQHGAFTHFKDNNGQSTIDLAQRRGLHNIVQMLKNEPSSATEKASPSPISSPALSGNGKLGQELLDAAWKGEIESIKKYLQEGADVFYKDTDGFRAIDRARDNGHEEIVELLKAAEGNIEQE